MGSTVLDRASENKKANEEIFRKLGKVLMICISCHQI
ncbi:Uncharacterised protein [Yersinia frederiksenii]|nr:Uncharacterised protein [Yersinia frederiksenii]